MFARPILPASLRITEKTVRQTRQVPQSEFATPFHRERLNDPLVIKVPISPEV